MTTSEAIEWLDGLQNAYDLCRAENEAVDMAIEALEEQEHVNADKS